MEKLSSQSPSKNLPKIEITSSSIITDDTVTTTTPPSTTPTPIDPHKWDAFAYGCLITVCIGVLCFFSCMAYKKHADYYSFQVTYSTYCIKGNKYSFVFLHFVSLIRMIIYNLQRQRYEIFQAGSTSWNVLVPFVADSLKKPHHMFA